MAPRKAETPGFDNSDGDSIPHIPVLIVGAGPTGLLLAGQLSRRQIPIHLIERNHAPLEWDRATVINTATLEVMDSLGIVDKFCNEGVHIRGSKMHSNGDSIGMYNFSENDSKFGHGLGLSEERTEHFLTEYLEDHGGKVNWSSKMIALDVLEDDKGVLATIERSTVEAGEVVSTHTYQIQADYCVGCDGIRSKTRELSGIQYEGHVIEQPWAVFDTKIAGWEEKGNSYEANYVYLDALTPVIMTPLPGKTWRIYLRPNDEDSDLAEEAYEVLRQYEPEVSFLDAKNFARFRCVSKVANTYRLGRVLLAGDAAHACTPAEGHGMNYGLQDSFNLGWKLAMVAKGTASEALLDSYGEERRPFAQMILKSGESSEKVVLMKDANQRAKRDKMLRSVFASVLGTRKKASVMSKTELNVEYSASSIVSGRGASVDGALCPGARFPNTLAVKLGPDDGWKASTLHELTFRSNHTILLLAGPDADGGELAELHKNLQELVSMSVKGESSSVFEAAYTFSIDPSHTSLNGKIGILESAAVETIGVSGITLLVVRPDGFVGMRCDGESEEYLKVMEKYRDGVTITSNLVTITE